MMRLQSWQFYSLLSAVFASLTAIFGKIGVNEINSDLATFIRVIVILFFNFAIVSFRGEWQGFSLLSQKGVLFLVLSGLATGASWLCYYQALKLGDASKVAPVDKLSVAFVILFSVLFLGESLSLKTVLGAGLILSGSLILIL